MLFGAQYVVAPVEYHQVWHMKTRVPCLTCGAVSVMIMFSLFHRIPDF